MGHKTKDASTAERREVVTEVLAQALLDLVVRQPPARREAERERRPVVEDAERERRRDGR